ncbi:MAG: hypothetical protein ACTHMM_18255 [Agriterribacter sp.]
MRLSNIAILAIRGHKDIKDMLSEALGVSKKVVYDYIRTNDDNLTKAAALEVIKKETGLNEDQILDKVPATAA